MESPDPRLLMLDKIAEEIIKKLTGTYNLSSSDKITITSLILGRLSATINSSKEYDKFCNAIASALFITWELRGIHPDRVTEALNKYLTDYKTRINADPTTKPTK